MRIAICQCVSDPVDAVFKVYGSGDLMKFEERASIGGKYATLVFDLLFERELSELSLETLKTLYGYALGLISPEVKKEHELEPPGTLFNEIVTMGNQAVEEASKYIE